MPTKNRTRYVASADVPMVERQDLRAKSIVARHRADFVIVADRDRSSTST